MKRTKTKIISNGSKWYGQELSTIDDLLTVLEDCTIEEHFFTPIIHRGKIVGQHSPINLKDGVYTFFGNFEEVSHVFNIQTNVPWQVKRISKAIRKNKGWQKYYEKNLIKIKTEI